MEHGDRSRLSIRALTLLMCPLTLTACIHLQRYPQSWESIARKDRHTECADVTGIYDNSGETTSGSQVPLAVWLDPTINHWNTPARTRVERELTSAQQVQLDVSRSQLQITAIGTGTRRQWSYRYACRRGKVHLARFGDLGGDNVALVGSDVLDLYRVKDHLVVNRHGVFAGVALLIPVAGYERTWTRFPVRPNPQ